MFTVCRCKLALTVLVAASFCAAALPQRQSTAPVIQRRESDLFFDPANPKPVSYRDQEVSMQLDSADHNLRISIQQNNKPRTEIVLPREIAQVNEILRGPSNQAIVTGMVNGDVSAVAILDLTVVRVADFFLAYEPHVSPNGRYVAFIKFYPPHGVQGVDSRYLLYDVAQTPRGNRLPNITLSDKADVGVTAYPVGIPNREGDNTEIPQADVHYPVTDSLFWNSASDRYAFADFYHDSLSLVVINVPRKGQPSASTFDVLEDNLCAPIHKKACQVHLSGVEFSTDGLTAYFRGIGMDGSLKNKVHFPLTSQRAASKEAAEAP